MDVQSWNNSIIDKTRTSLDAISTAITSNCFFLTLREHFYSMLIKTTNNGRSKLEQLFSTVNIG